MRGLCGLRYAMQRRRAARRLHQKRPLSHQHEPQQVIEAVVTLIAADAHAYRTGKPQTAEDMVKREQAEEWEMKV
jgi:hypothetical protein